MLRRGKPISDLIKQSNVLELICDAYRSAYRYHQSMKILQKAPEQFEALRGLYRLIHGREDRIINSSVFLHVIDAAIGAFHLSMQEQKDLQRATPFHGSLIHLRNQDSIQKLLQKTEDSWLVLSYSDQHPSIASSVSFPIIASTWHELADTLKEEINVAVVNISNGKESSMKIRFFRGKRSYQSHEDSVSSFIIDKKGIKCDDNHRIGDIAGNKTALMHCVRRIMRTNELMRGSIASICNAVKTKIKQSINYLRYESLLQLNCTKKHCSFLIRCCHHTDKR